MDRLQAIFSVIPECEVLADVGCDHGKLTRQVALSGKAKKVIATDISQTCLNKAMELNADLDNVEYGVGDGLKALQGKKCDVIVLSGMGGNTMMSILAVDMFFARLKPATNTSMLYFVREQMNWQRDLRRSWEHTS